MAKIKDEVAQLRKCNTCFWSKENDNNLHCILRMKDENTFSEISKVEESKCFYFRHKLS